MTRASDLKPAAPLRTRGAVVRSLTADTSGTRGTSS